ncbi:MAG: glycine cleavage system protein GcvH [Rhodospirillales bacterium]
MSVYYTEDHEWISVDDGGVGTVGVTEYAQSQLGDVVFVDLPEVGAAFSERDDTGVIESVKAASELYAPCAGEVTEVNEVLSQDPSLVNSSPEDKAWIYKIKIEDVSVLESLMDEAAYKAHVAALEA